MLFLAESESEIWKTMYTTVHGWLADVEGN